MIIRWLGHSCFEIKGKYVSVVTDPFDDTVGYPRLSLGADYATISHHHADHSDTSWIIGCDVVESIGVHKFSNITITGIESYHDKKEGKLRGKNIIFKFEIEGIIFCHLGDLGHTIDEKLWRSLGRIDVLFLPIGGTYTIDAYEAMDVMTAIDPYLTIAMHFRTQVCGFPINTQDEFLKLTNGTQMRESAIMFSRKELISGKNVIALDWARD